ncbi:MAG TPA: Rap1a/Tai family immunity protein [Acidobacteriaceae bacterium]|nr:Rap1a/Tai family immunity protein [Acidobacteriaceae bacterium]
MLFAPLLFALATPAAHADPAPDPSKGAALLRGCQAEVRLMELPSLSSAEPIDLINGAYCVGYLNGFTAGLTPATAAICTGEDSMAALVRAYVRFMERNPKLLDEDKRVGLRLALQEAYPCPAGTVLPEEPRLRTGVSSGHA